jgi:mono/diheme cytochrome c family protein
MLGAKGRSLGSKRSFHVGWITMVIVLAIAGAWMWIGPRSPRSGPATTAELIQQGQSLFARNCMPCHGPNGVGQNPAEPNGGYDEHGNLIAPALDGSAHAWHHPDDVLFQWIKHGSALGDSPMRGWEGRMTDEEIWAVIRYFQSLWPARQREIQQQRGWTQ